MYASLALAALAVAPVFGEDVLHSKRMHKRQAEDDFSFCKFPQSVVRCRAGEHVLT